MGIIIGEKSVDNVDPTDLMEGITEELSETLKKENAEKKEDPKGQEIKSTKEKRKEETRKEDLQKMLEKKKAKHQKEEQDKERKQKEKDRQKEKERREKRSKPYSQTELRDDLDVDERQRIKLMAQKMKEEAMTKKDSLKKESSNKGPGTSKLLAGLGKIPKLPRKSDGDKNTEDAKKKKKKRGEKKKKKKKKKK